MLQQPTQQLLPATYTNISFHLLSANMIYDINSMRYNDFDKKQIEFLSLLAGELWALFIKISLIYSKPQIQGGPVIDFTSRYFL